jgi:hypothetical protein
LASVLFYKFFFLLFFSEEELLRDPVLKIEGAEEAEYRLQAPPTLKENTTSAVLVVLPRARPNQ